MKNLFLFLTVLVIFYSCAPDPLVMKNGEEIDKKIKSGKLKVAVMPTVDYSEKPTCIQGYFLGGCLGAFDNGYAFDDGGFVFTNEITRGLWKQNVCYMSKPNEIVQKCQNYNLTAEELFPAGDKAFYNCILPVGSPIQDPMDVGNGKSPNYSKLYKIGDELGADILLLSRVSENMETGYCLPPFGIIWLMINPTDFQMISIELIAIDVKSKEIISFGQLGSSAKVGQESIDSLNALDTYSRQAVFYFNLPSEETEKNKALASAASYVSKFAANLILSNLTYGLISLPVAIEFDYNYEDVTWQQYGEGYFEKNLSWSHSEYLKAIGQ